MTTKFHELYIVLFLIPSVYRHLTLFEAFNLWAKFCNLIMDCMYVCMHFSKAFALSLLLYISSFQKLMQLLARNKFGVKNTLIDQSAFKCFTVLDLT